MTRRLSKCWFIGVFLFLCAPIFAQYEDIEAHPTYYPAIKKHFSSIALEPDQRIIVIGEDHDFETDNVLIRLAMIEELIQRGKPFHVVLEFPYSVGLLINRYLQHDDQTILEHIVSRQWTWEIFYEIRQMKVLYDQSSIKFEVHGTDVPWQGTPRLTLLALNDIFKRNNTAANHWAPEIRELFELTQQQEGQARKQLVKELGHLSENIVEQLNTPNTYQREAELFDEDWSTLVQLIQHYAFGERHRKNKKGTNREVFIYQNTLQLLNQHPTDYFYIHYGLAHINKGEAFCYCDGPEEPFVKKLSKQGHSIFNILPVYNYTTLWKKEFSWAKQDANRPFMVGIKSLFPN
ncbi:MAG: hypothetical protein AAF598_19475 [Bacteroidota bacterium]